MKTKAITVLAAFATAFGICLNALAFSVCAVGDSITQGGTSFTAHRVALESEFAARGWLVEWKGTRSDASWGSTNPCEGYSGQNAEYIAGQYEENATNVVADVLLLHAGHNYNNDPSMSKPAYMPVDEIVAHATNAHARIIAKAREHNPNVIVLYAQVITSGGTEAGTGREVKYSYITNGLNQAIGVLGAQLNTPDSPVVVVDMAKDWNYKTDCVEDHVHPTAAGAAKMAAKWMAAIDDLVDEGKLTVVTGLTVSSDMTLTADAAYDTVTVAANATLNLNGHKLTTGGVSGGGTIISAAFDSALLPGGYELLSYVMSPEENNTASCHVDVVIVPAKTDRVETKVTLGSVSGTQWIFGSYEGGKRFDAYITGSRLKLQLGSNTNQEIAPKANDTYEIVLDGNASKAVVAKIGAASSEYAIDSSSFTPSRRLYLFGANDNGPVYPGRMANACKMYYFRVYDEDGNLKANMLPARDTSGVVGFYDIVRKKFFKPAAGELTAGDNISYEPLAYVKTAADVDTLVDTKYMPHLTDRVETRVRFGTLGVNQGVFSARQTTATNTFSCIMYTSKLRFDHHTTEPYVFHRAEGSEDDTEYTTDTDYEIVMDGNTLAFSVDGVPSYTRMTDNPEDATVTPGITFRLFAVATKGVGHTLYAKGLRMYRFRVTDADGYERLNLIPARRKSDGEVGFYDAVRNTFIVQFTGALEAGDALLRDLTVPGGMCAMPTPTEANGANGGTVANLFNDNFIYKTDATHRLLLDTSKTNQTLPLRVDYDFGEGGEVAVNMCRIYAGYNVRAPKKWRLYGSNESSAFNAETDDGWTELDSRDSQTDWTHDSSINNSAECRTKAFANDTPYRYYRLKVEKRNDETQKYLELVQIEYFRVESTSDLGELHIAVAEGEAETNSTVQLGGGLKLVKEGEGEFVSDVSGQFYTGGTKVDAGRFTLGAPLSTSLTMANDNTTLGFLFHDKYTAPLLTLGDGSSLPSPLYVAIDLDGDFVLPPKGTVLTDDYDLGGNTVSFLNQSRGARRMGKNDDGNLVVCGPAGLMIEIR